MRKPCPDGVELGPNSQPWLGDLDGDQISNEDEAILNTLPCDYDTDLDGVADGIDNCSLVKNPPKEEGAPQADADHDGHGDLCDSDFNNDLWVTAVDEKAFMRAYMKCKESPRESCDADGKNCTEQPCNEAAGNKWRRIRACDANGDEIVNLFDYAVFKSHLGGHPGPSPQALEDREQYAANEPKPPVITSRASATTRLTISAAGSRESMQPAP